MATADPGSPHDPIDDVERAERSRMTAQETSWALREFTRAAVDVDYLIARRLDLRPMDYTALNHIFGNAGSLSPHHVSARLGISTGSASELLDRLERAGHIERHRSADDRRRVTLEPTPSAVENVLSTLQPLIAALDDLAEEYTPAEREVITQYLRGAVGVLRQYERAGDT
ncbi:MarR family winged helix-turn-helix transcriptional regulator [Mycobacterium antarcticum]|uniref:MarR family winged helix-turn-helix transcriptional regulator n=1 Tax=unclassified Mycolicibacterium TaxID=2636767 RepID=UPI0024E12C3A|nr:MULTISPECIES: MarR family transcriptional regulator [unclassified Mycolicibacterium]